MIGRAVVRPFGKVELADEALVTFVTVLVFASFVASAAEMKMAHGVMGQCRRLRQMNFEVAVSLRSLQRPVLIAFEATAFYEVGNHDDDVRVVIPNHLPEVFESRRDGT